MPIGTAALIAGIASTALGTGQLIAGGVKGKKAKALTPSLEDPEQRLALAEMRRKARAYETGAAFNKERQDLQNLAKQTIAGAGRISGGAGGAAIAAGTRASASIGKVLGDLGLKSRQIGLQTSAQANQMLDAIAQRKLELQMLQRQEKSAEAAQLKKAGMQNLLAGVTSAIGGAGKGVNASTTAGIGTTVQPSATAGIGTTVQPSSAGSLVSGIQALGKMALGTSAAPQASAAPQVPDNVVMNISDPNLFGDPKSSDKMFEFKTLNRPTIGKTEKAMMSTLLAAMGNKVADPYIDKESEPEDIYGGLNF